MQFQRRALHIEVCDGDKRRGITRGNLYSAQLIGKLSVIQANIVEPEVLRYRQIITFNHAVTDQHSGTIDHIDIINNEIITAINCYRGVVYSRLLAEIGCNILSFYIPDNKVFAVFNVDQLATVAAGDICHHEILHGLLFRVVIVVGASRKANANAPVDFAVGAVDVVYDVVRNQDIAVVDGHVPLDGISLQVAEPAVGDTRAVDLVMKALTQNGVVGLANVDVINDQVAHHSRLFAADIDLRHGAEAAHRQPFNHAVRSAHVESDIVGAPCPLSDDFTAFLKHKAASPVALEPAAYQKRFTVGNKNPGIDVFTDDAGGDNNGVGLVKRLLEGGDPVVVVVLINGDGLPGCRPRSAGRQQRHSGQDGE